MRNQERKANSDTRKAIDPEAVVEMLLKLPARHWTDSWCKFENILSATAPFGIEANRETLLDALRELYRQQRIKHKQIESQHAFRIANVEVEIAQIDAAYIKNQLRLLRWTATGDEYYRIKAVPNAAFWAAWERDPHYIKNRHLVVQPDENRKWTVYCFDAMLSDLLLRRNA